MSQRPKSLPEKLHGSAVSWEGWTFHILSSPAGLRFVDLVGTPFSQLAGQLKARVVPDDASNDEILGQVRDYLRGDRRTFDLPLDLRGTPFQESVWRAMAKIPYGDTTTYGALAAGIGRPQAARAVGQAVGANPVPIVVPCHRVVGTSGSLTGFGGGLPLKERLLALEQGSLSL
ncbi:MAG: methylated-DNA--[protein]-cysteine S-methyltransferase [Candidatus Bipolaricaulota bacterium]|nr:methylated-DNA--[protein]-cysteine S-methyltransferase [Candidatus Bipolaricaulota bacterium]